MFLIHPHSNPDIYTYTIILKPIIPIAGASIFREVTSLAAGFVPFSAGCTRSTFCLLVPKVADLSPKHRIGNKAATDGTYRSKFPGFGALMKRAKSTTLVPRFGTNT